MCGRLQTFVVSLLVASLAHLPVPVWDGDDVGSGNPAVAARAVACRDIDLILLGCDLPDDCDDGPTDDDPDDGTLDAGLGPAYRASALVSAVKPVDSPSAALAIPDAGIKLLDLLARDGGPGDGTLVHAARPRPATTVLRL